MDMINYLFSFLLSLFSGLNSTMILAISTVVLTGATIALAYFTLLLYRETRTMRLAQIRPEISMYISPEKQWINLIDLVIKNTGPGTAYNVSFSVNSEFYCGHRIRNKRLADLNLIKNGVTIMSPNQEFKFLLIFLLDYKGQSLPVLDLSVSYESSSGEKYEKNYNVDFSILLDLSMEPDYTHKISDSLEQIEKHIGELSDKLRR